jgi:putative transcriptional regulator
MISYKPFQKLLIDKGLRKTDVIKAADISNATMAKLNTTDYVSLEVIDKLCAALNCQPGDLLEHIPDKEGEGNNA